ncbi:hypothetical protein GTY84_18210 [Streptomyces sp. SID8352]|nr:hypothetical protein [Streptomyces sp. SID8352]
MPADDGPAVPAPADGALGAARPAGSTAEDTPGAPPRTPDHGTAEATAPETDGATASATAAADPARGTPEPGAGAVPGDTPGNADAPPPSGGPEDTPAGSAPAPRRRPRLRLLRRIALGAVLVVLLPLLAVETALYANGTGTPADGTLTRGRDALWLGHAWVDGRRDAADLDALARRLKGTGIRDLYVHTGPLEHDGTLPRDRYPAARRLTEAVHRRLPGVRVQAFLGDVLATEDPDGMRLERAATRAGIVRSAREVLDGAGYDGVHLDLEPLPSGDGDFLALLDDLRALTRSRDALLSVAAHQIDPLPGLHVPWRAVTGHPKWWTQRFFGQVARRVDQIALMSYDTMQPLAATYRGHLAQQTALALEATPPGTHLLMGLPFFHENRFGHWNHAETVPAAVRGIRLGLSRTDPDRALFGVALYIDFAATEADWAGYRDGWLG